MALGVFPQDWREHSGAASDPSNYRPISLLPAVEKVLDHLHSQALRHFLLNGLISDSQASWILSKTLHHGSASLCH